MIRAADPALTELLRDVRRLALATRRPVASTLAGSYRSVFRGPGLDFEEVREYEPGDDPRTIDWNVTARTGRPFVKRYVDGRALTLLLLLDRSASMHGGAGRAAARLAAALALSAVADHDRVGLIPFGAALEPVIPPRNGVRHALRIVRECVAESKAGGASRLDLALAYSARALRRRATRVGLSDFWTDG